jgi:hypothetical protein
MDADAAAVPKADENAPVAVATPLEQSPKTHTDVAGTAELGTPINFAAAHADPPGSGEKVPLQQIKVSPSTLETVSRCALLGSAALYGIGLLIANFNSQLYGRYGLGFVEAQYVLVGLLWLALTLLGFALTRTAFRWVEGRGPWTVRPLKQNVTNALWVVLGWLGLLCVYTMVINFLGVANPFWSWQSLAILGVLMMTNLAFGALFQETWGEMKSRSQPSDSFLVKLWKADSIQLTKRVLYFLTALSLYATYVYPQLSPAVGGGKLHQAEIMIRQDRRSIFDGMAEFKIDKVGKLGPVGIVAESDESIIVTAPDKPWWKVGGPSLRLKKDLIELVIYTK